MFKLNDEERDFIQTTMESASHLGIDCILTYLDDRIIDGSVTVKSTMSAGEIGDIVNSEFCELDECSAAPTFRDLLRYAVTGSSDANGWRDLTIDSDRNVAIRWLMRIRRDAYKLSIYRYEYSKLIEICDICFDRDDFIDAFNYNNFICENPITITPRAQSSMSEEGDILIINGDTHICDVDMSNWSNALGIYGVSFIDLLINILSPIADDMN